MFVKRKLQKTLQFSLHLQQIVQKMRGYGLDSPERTEKQRGGNDPSRTERTLQSDDAVTRIPEFVFNRHELVLLESVPDARKNHIAGIVAAADQIAVCGERLRIPPRKVGFGYSVEERMSRGSEIRSVGMFDEIHRPAGPLRLARLHSADSRVENAVRPLCSGILFKHNGVSAAPQPFANRGSRAAGVGAERIGSGKQTGRSRVVVHDFCRIVDAFAGD